MVTVVQGKVCAKNHPDRLSRLATIHQRYRQTDGRTDFLWHRPGPNGRPKMEEKPQPHSVHKSTSSSMYILHEAMTITTIYTRNIQASLLLYHKFCCKSKNAKKTNSVRPIMVCVSILTGVNLGTREEYSTGCWSGSEYAIHSRDFLTRI